MKQQMMVRTEQNEEFLCNIVARWSNQNHNYIAYTDGSKTDDKLDLFIAKYIEDNGIIKIIEIEESKELEYVNNYLNENLFKEDENYD